MAVATEAKGLRAARRRPFDSDYWLCRCEGFQVDSRHGPLGTVEEVRFHSRVDRPDWLAVRTGGLFSRRLRVISVDYVAAILPREGLIVLGRPSYVLSETS